MQEDYIEIEEFPNYYVSNFGKVVNMARGGAELAQHINQQGIVRVGMVRDRIQHTRAVAPLVGHAFLPDPPQEHNTIIHLDGNRQNCRADNLMWRPRWFAIKFHKQFLWDAFWNNYNHPLYEVESGRTYQNATEVCMTEGLYISDVVKSYVEETFVPITYQEFRFLK